MNISWTSCNYLPFTSRTISKKIKFEEKNTKTPKMNKNVIDMLKGKLFFEFFLLKSVHPNTVDTSLFFVFS